MRRCRTFYHDISELLYRSRTLVIVPHPPVAGSYTSGGHGYSRYIETSIFLPGGGKLKRTLDFCKSNDVRILRNIPLQKFRKIFVKILSNTKEKYRSLEEAALEIVALREILEDLVRLPERIDRLPKLQVVLKGLDDSLYHPFQPGSHYGRRWLGGWRMISILSFFNDNYKNHRLALPLADFEIVVMPFAQLKNASGVELHKMSCLPAGFQTKVRGWFDGMVSSDAIQLPAQIARRRRNRRNLQQDLIDMNETIFRIALPNIKSGDGRELNRWKSIRRGYRVGEWDCDPASGDLVSQSL